MGEILTVADIRRSSWREDYEEETTRNFERHKRELDAERERKAHVVAKKQQPVANNSEAWERFVDSRVHQWIVAERDFM